MLTRDSGLGGSVDFSGTPFFIDRWEIFEGDPENPNQCRGWFRCDDPAFQASNGNEVLLNVDAIADRHRNITAEVTHVSPMGPIWEFRAV